MLVSITKLAATDCAHERRERFTKRSDIGKEVLEVVEFTEFYLLIKERWHSGFSDQPLEHVVAYNHRLQYIGSPEFAKALCDKRGIAPELSDPDHNVCSVGWCEKEQKWYGWSHRAIYGFEIGYVAKEGDLPTMSGYIDGYLEEHPEEDRRVPVGFECRTLDDCRRCAVAFADSVS